MSFRYETNTVQYYLDKAERRVKSIRTDNVGTEDEHLRRIIGDLTELCYYLALRMACIADNVYLPEGVEEK
ncbi:hypothetical protein KAR91_78045 [Candidatus Pacearchaeota archaeon]|nr:hypothetical protein [Candidatus Pacearchaeota archaeon]